MNYLDDMLDSDYKNPENLKDSNSSLIRDWPNGVSRDEISSIIEELQDISEKCAIAFMETSPSILDFFSKEKFYTWASLGKRILNQSSERAPLCVEYIHSSLKFLSLESFENLNTWVEHGLRIVEHSIPAATQFLGSTEDFLNKESFYRLGPWADKAIQIIHSGENREQAAIHFLRLSTDMIPVLSFRGLENWKSAGLKIAKISSELTSEFFSEIPSGLDALYKNEIEGIFRLCTLIGEVSSEDAVDFYKRSAKVLINLNPNVRSEVIEAILRISSREPERIIEIFEKTASELGTLPWPAQADIIKYEHDIGEISREGSKAYLSHVASIYHEIPEIFFPKWIEKGISILHQNHSRGVDYFSLRSPESRSELSRWKEAVSLEDCRTILSIFVHALTGKKLQLRNVEEIDAKEISSARHYPTGNGADIYLPSFFAEEPSREGNYRLYKLAAAHQAGYTEFGTFDSGFSSILLILDSLELKTLARDLFFIIEDGRIDRMLKESYKGLKAEIDLAFSSAMKRRISPANLPLLESLVEILLRMTTGYFDEKNMTSSVLKYVLMMEEALAGFYERSNNAWDSLSKAVELYGFLSGLAQGSSYTSYLPVSFHQTPEIDIFPGAGFQRSVSDDIEEMNDEEHGGGIPIDPEDLKKILENLDDLSLLRSIEGDPSSQGLFVTDLDGSEIKGEKRILDNDDVQKNELPLSLKGPRSTGQNDIYYYYDEWDYLQAGYRRRWCRLCEKDVPLLDPRPYNEIYESYSDLIQKVRKQFLRIRPNIYEVVRRVEWGEEIDLTAMIQAMVDRKAGISPCDRVFSRKDKRVRKISTLLLIDMSASTDELVSTVMRKGGLDHESLYGDKPGLDKEPRKNKKIIDIEMESLVVMMEALDALDDEYAVFGFSGQGRDNIELYTIKDFCDPYSDQMKARVGGIKPKQSTRMGPVIRHASQKLKHHDSDLRLLILLSDGYPQDLDYGEDRRSNEYALNDTMMALIEAENEGIQPFCITVDQSGNDYLRKMCDPGSYLVIKDIYSLPEILPKVVESLIG